MFRTPPDTDSRQTRSSNPNRPHVELQGRSSVPVTRENSGSQAEGGSTFSEGSASRPHDQSIPMSQDGAAALPPDGARVAPPSSAADRSNVNVSSQSSGNNQSVPNRGVLGTPRNTTIRDQNHEIHRGIMNMGRELAMSPRVWVQGLENAEVGRQTKLLAASPL